jgi:CHAD domain-containing protein
MPIDQQRSRSLFLKLNRLLSRVPSRPIPDVVHQLRTTTRRVEALLEALSPDADRSQRRLARSLKRLRRRAGRIRDLDVHQAALRSLKIGRDTNRKQQLMTELGERRSRQERKLLKRLDRESVTDLRKRLNRAAAQVLKPANGRRTRNPGSNPGVSHQQMDPLATALRMFARMARETGPLTDANLHQFRTRCKRIRYVAEMGGDKREIESVVKEFKRLQDAVGIWHDWLTLTQAADDLFGSPNDSALLNALQNITRAKFVEALRTASDVKRNLLAIRVPAPRPALKATKPAKPRVAARAAVRPGARKAVRPTTAKPATPKAAASKITRAVQAADSPIAARKVVRKRVSPKPKVAPPPAEPASESAPASSPETAVPSPEPSTAETPAQAQAEAEQAEAPPSKPSQPESAPETEPTEASA